MPFLFSLKALVYCYILRNIQNKGYDKFGYSSAVNVAYICNNDIALNSIALKINDRCPCVSSVSILIA